MLGDWSCKKNMGFGVVWVCFFVCFVGLYFFIFEHSSLNHSISLAVFVLLCTHCCSEASLSSSPMSAV